MAGGVTFENNRGPIRIENEAILKRSTILGKLIEIFATSDPQKVNLDREPVDTEEKIEFNNLFSHRWVIDEYIDNYMLIENSITELNKQINNGSTKLKRQIKHFYHEALSKFGIPTKPIDLEKLKANSDNVVAEVISLATDFVKASKDLQDGYFEEDITLGIATIISYSIIECIVLENPNDHH